MGIVAGIPNKSFEVWRFKVPIEQLLQHPKGAEMVKNVIMKDITPTLNEGKIIMNTNIPIKLLEQAGLKKHQFAELGSGASTIQQKQTENKLPRKGRGL